MVVYKLINRVEDPREVLEGKELLGDGESEDEEEEELSGSEDTDVSESDANESEDTDDDSAGKVELTAVPNATYPYPDLTVGFWPDAVLCSFEDAEESPMHEFHGPWNRLLNFIFPAKSIFEVAPFLYGCSESQATALFLVVKKLDKPVLFVEVLPKENIHSISGRHEADARIRSYFSDVSRSVETLMLHGISAFGSKVAFYHFDKINDTVHPKAVCGVVPEDQWSDDITRMAGAVKLTKMVEEVKAYSALQSR